jgi:hypothetical protein
MSQELEQLCQDYLNDNLPPSRRKQVEQRIANGDAELISTINRLRSFQKPTSGSQRDPHTGEDDPSLFGAYMSHESTEPSSAGSKQPPKTDKSISKPSGSNKTTRLQEQTDDEAESNGEKNKVRLLQIAGGVIIVLLLFFIYYQWQNQLMERKLTMTEEQMDKVSTRLKAMQRQELRSDRQFSLLKSIVSSPLFERIPITSDNPSWTRGLMLWDRSTLRTGWLIGEAQLPEAKAFYVWTADKDNQWKYAGMIDRIRPDSLYTNWDNRAFNQARRLEIRLDSLIAEPSQRAHTHGSLITRVTMPR